MPTRRMGWRVFAASAAILAPSIVIADPVLWQRSFTVGSGAPGTSVTAVFHGKTLYCLICNIQSKSCTIETRALDESVAKASWPLPSTARYSGIGVRESGNSVVRYRQGRESGIAEFNGDGQEVRTVATGAQSSSHTVVGDLYFANNLDGSVEVRDLAGSASQPLRYASGFTPESFVRAERTVGNKAVLVNQNTGGLVRLDPQSGPVAASLDAPEVRASFSHYDHIAQAAPPGSGPIHGLVIVASGSDGTGNVYAMISPWRADTGAPILTFTDQGSLKNKAYYKLPDREAMPQFATPVEIGTYGNELFIVFGEGGVLAYPRGAKD